MKTAFSILLLGIFTASAQYQLVEGRAYSLTDENAGWTKFTNLHIDDVIDGDMICRAFTTKSVTDAGYFVANHYYAPTHVDRIWGEKLVIRNYPTVNRMNPGDEIGGPIYAMRVRQDSMSSPGGSSVTTTFQDNRGYAATTRTKFSMEQGVQIYDMGTPYVAPPKILTPEEQKIAGLKKEKEARKLIKWLSLQATNGSTSAQCSLGRRYYYGDGVVTNRDLGLYWLKVSANSGDTEASNALAKIYAPPVVVKSDDE